MRAREIAAVGVLSVAATAPAFFQHDTLPHHVIAPSTPTDGDHVLMLRARSPRLAAFRAKYAFGVARGIQARQEAALVAARQEAQRYEPATHTENTTASAVTGSCAEMKPAGFPDAIVQRESGGDPNAYNASGARGCAQILDSHFNSGGTCAGLDYGSCWQKMYDEQGLTPWACTPESGCG